MVGTGRPGRTGRGSILAGERIAGPRRMRLRRSVTMHSLEAVWRSPGPVRAANPPSASASRGKRQRHGLVHPKLRQRETVGSQGQVLPLGLQGRRGYLSPQACRQTDR